MALMVISINVAKKQHRDPHSYSTQIKVYIYICMYIWISSYFFCSNIHNRFSKIAIYAYEVAARKKGVVLKMNYISLVSFSLLLHTFISTNVITDETEQRVVCKNNKALQIWFVSHSIGVVSSTIIVRNNWAKTRWGGHGCDS